MKLNGMNKIAARKAQVTAFIMIGLMLLLLIAMLYYLQRNYFAAQLPEEELPEEIKPIKLAVESCLAMVLDDAVNFVSLRGGYYEMPEAQGTTQETTVTLIEENNPLFMDIPYYYHNNQAAIPTEQQFSDALAQYLEENSDVCFNAETEVYSIKQLNNPTAEITLSPTFIAATLEAPTQITTNTSTTTLQQFSITLPTQVLSMFNLAKAIAFQQTKEAPLFCLACIKQAKQSAGKNVTITINEYQGEERIVLFTLISQEQQKERTFLFAGKYSQQEEDTFLLQSIPDQEATLGYPQQVQLKATHAIEHAQTSPSWFVFDEEKQVLSFTPTEEQLGEHLVELIAADAQGKKVTEYFTIVVSDVAQRPELAYLGYQTAKIGVPFMLDVMLAESGAEETKDKIKDIYFTDDTELFTIGTTTGKIQFTPIEQQRGSHIITITAIDKTGGSDEEQLHLLIY